MFRHLLKIAARNFIRNKSYALINIFGLSFGLTTFILIGLFVQYEYSFDKYHDNYDRIFRIQRIAHLSTGNEYWSQLGYPIPHAMKEKFPELEEVAVTRPVWGEYLSSSDKLTFFEDDGLYTDPTLFDILTVRFIEGEASSSLVEPHSIVLTETLKKKYFGDLPALGKFIKAKNKFELKVTGVIEDIPKNSSLEVSYFSPIKLLEILEGRELDDQWDNGSYYAYALLGEHATKEEVDAKITDFIKEHEQFKDNPTKYTAWLNPITKVHLLQDPSNRGLLIIVYLYIGVAIFALIIACINFMNLTTAYSVSRAKEIGIKKVVGSSRKSLTWQFLFESVLVALVSMHIAFVLAEFALPIFNSIVARSLELSFIENWRFILFIVAISMLTGIISGMYPAFYLSKFNPSRALKSVTSFSNTKSPLRRTLVTFQFVLSSMLILSTIVVYKQFDFMKNKELGFDHDQVMHAYIGADEKENSRKLEIIKSRLDQYSAFKSVTMSQTIPFYGSQGTNVTWEEAQPNETINARYNFVGYDFLKTFGIDMVQGRNFSPEFTADLKECVVINETAAKIFGWENPLDKTVEFWGENYRVIGIVKDFHPYSVFERIPPYIFRLHSENIDQGGMHSIRITAGSDILETKEQLAGIYKEVFPNTLFDFQFLGNNMDETVWVIYNGIVKTFLFFSLITISIAVVGMFGLVAFTTKARTKEIGIRKVHGASIGQIFALLAKEFVIIIIIAVILSFPAGLGFRSIDPAAYKPEGSVSEYLITGILVFLVTFFTITFHTSKASKQNPSEALRYE